MTITRLSWFVVFCLLGGFAAGCVTDSDTFESARYRDTVASYEAYLESYPQGEHSQDALARIDELVDEQDFAKATKTATTSAFVEYAEKHPSGRFVSKAGEIILGEAISTKRYSSLLSARDFANKYGLASQAATARQELSKYAIRTVPPPGESLWTVRSEQPAPCTLEVQCAMTSSKADKIGKLLAKNWVNELRSKSFQEAYGIDIKGLSEEGTEYLGEIYHKNEIAQREKASGWYAWYLYPAEEADYVRVTSGEIGLLSGVGGSKSVVWITDSDPFTRKTAQDSAFSAVAHSDGRPASLLAVFGLCPPSADGMSPDVVGLVEFHSLDSPSLQSSAGSVLPQPCKVTGELRIPSDRWIPLREGMEVRGGGIQLDASGARLLPGTEVVEFIK